MLNELPVSLTHGYVISGALCIGLVVGDAGCQGPGGMGGVPSAGGVDHTENPQKNFPQI